MSKMLDLAIIGSGPAALAAALYAVRLELAVQVIEKNAYGGMLAQISDLRNYPGFRGSGPELAQQMRQQVEAYSKDILRYGECTNLRAVATSDQEKPRQNYFELTLDDEEILRSRTVLVATGASPRQLSFELNVPVSYCALCDAELARGKRVAVVGGANAAVQESVFLVSIVSSLDLFTHSQLKADQILQDELRQAPNVTIHEQIEPTAELLNQFDHVFVFIGQTPATKFLHNLPEYSQILDRSGRILTGASAEFPHKTITPGLFAAGDVRSGAVRQVITAAGDGAAAAIEIAKYL